MRVTHQFLESSPAVSKTDSRCRGFCLADFCGGYFWLDEAPSSRYQGWFINKGGTLVKTLENIELLGAGPVLGIVNNLWNVQRVRGAIRENFFIPLKRQAVVYELSRASDIALTFDVKDSFENDEMGRIYRISRENELVLVHFKLDKPGGRELFLAVACDSPKIKVIQNWIRRDYSYDRARGSRPFSRWVFKAVVAQGASKIVIAAGDDRDQAIKEAGSIFNNLKKNQNERKNNFLDSRAVFDRNFGVGSAAGPRFDPELAASGLCGANALNSLLSPKNGGCGLFAGFPWFFQFWLRDEALSLIGLSYANAATARSVFSGLMADLEAGFDAKSRDGIGWFFFAARHFYFRRLLGAQLQGRLILLLEKYISYALKNQTIDKLAINESRGTWMDSVDRFEASIEAQALRLNLYGLAALLSKNSAKREFYRSLEIELLLKTRKRFASGVCLADGFDPRSGTIDATIRPNIFLAAYAYPQLLENWRWQQCFDAILSKLWLNWGGLASIDPGDRRFRGLDSGENPESYHDGDSWFYVNNIAALVLHRLNPVKNHAFVKKIFDAGKQNVLWGQVPGFAGEISSADKFQPAGCFNQAWSNATFLELFQAIGASRQKTGER